MDIQRVLERRCQIGKKFRQSTPQGLGNEQCAPDHRNIEKQGQDNVPGPGALLQENSPPDKTQGTQRMDSSAESPYLWCDDNTRNVLLFGISDGISGSTTLTRIDRDHPSGVIYHPFIAALVCGIGELLTNTAHQICVPYHLHITTSPRRTPMKPKIFIRKCADQLQSVI